MIEKENTLLSSDSGFRVHESIGTMLQVPQANLNFKVTKTNPRMDCNACKIYPGILIFILYPLCWVSNASGSGSVPK